MEKKSENDIEDLIVRMLQIIGENANRDGLIDTPRRMKKALLELTQGYRTECPKITTFKNEAKEQDVVFDEGEYYSLCEHHILPFFGKYIFAYIPKKDGRILGISKVARIVKWCSQKLQIQERLGKEIVEKLNEVAQAEGMCILLRGKHLCKTMRGACNNGEMTTFYAVGTMNNDYWRRQLISLLSVK